MLTHLITLLLLSLCLRCNGAHLPPEVSSFYDILDSPGDTACTTDKISKFLKQVCPGGACFEVLTDHLCDSDGETACNKGEKLSRFFDLAVSCPRVTNHALVSWSSCLHSSSSKRLNKAILSFHKSAKDKGFFVRLDKSQSPNIALVYDSVVISTADSLDRISDFFNLNFNRPQSGNKFWNQVLAHKNSIVICAQDQQTTVSVQDLITSLDIFVSGAKKTEDDKEYHLLKCLFVFMDWNLIPAAARGPLFRVATKYLDPRIIETDSHYFITLDGGISTIHERYEFISQRNPSVGPLNLVPDQLFWRDIETRTHWVSIRCSSYNSMDSFFQNLYQASGVQCDFEKYYKEQFLADFFAIGAVSDPKNAFPINALTGSQSGRFIGFLKTSTRPYEPIINNLLHYSYDDYISARELGALFSALGLTRPSCSVRVTRSGVISIYTPTKIYDASAPPMDLDDLWRGCGWTLDPCIAGSLFWHSGRFPSAAEVDQALTRIDLSTQSEVRKQLLSTSDLTLLTHPAIGKCSTMALLQETDPRIDLDDGSIVVVINSTKSSREVTVPISPFTPIELVHEVIYRSDNPSMIFEAIRNSSDVNNSEYVSRVVDDYVNLSPRLQRSFGSAAMTFGLSAVALGVSYGFHLALLRWVVLPVVTSIIGHGIGEGGDIVRDIVVGAAVGLFIGVVTVTCLSDTMSARTIAIAIFCVSQPLSEASGFGHLSRGALQVSGILFLAITRWLLDKILPETACYIAAIGLGFGAALHSTIKGRENPLAIIATGVVGTSAALIAGPIVPFVPIFVDFAEDYIAPISEKRPVTMNTEFTGHGRVRYSDGTYFSSRNRQSNRGKFLGRYINPETGTVRSLRIWLNQAEKEQEKRK